MKRFSLGLTSPHGEEVSPKSVEWPCFALAVTSESGNRVPQIACCSSGAALDTGVMPRSFRETREVGLGHQQWQSRVPFKGGKLKLATLAPEVALRPALHTLKLKAQDAIKL